MKFFTAYLKLHLSNKLEQVCGWNWNFNAKNYKWWYQLRSKRIPRHLTFRVELIRPQMETFCSFDCSAAVSANSELNVCHLSFAHLGDPGIPIPPRRAPLIRQRNVQTSVSPCRFTCPIPTRPAFSRQSPHEVALLTPLSFWPRCVCSGPRPPSPPPPPEAGKNTCLQRAKPTQNVNRH